MDLNFTRSASVSGIVFAPIGISSEGWIPSQRASGQAKLSFSLQSVDEPKLQKSM